MFSLKRNGVYLIQQVHVISLHVQSPIQWVPGALSLGGKAAGVWSWLHTSI